MRRPKVRLTPRQHDVVSRYVEGKTAAQTAIELGIALPTVREQVWRAKLAYRTAGLDVSTKIALREAYQRNTLPR